MTLTQLRTFVAVADTGSVRAAAEQLYVTQSAVSAALAALQRDLGAELVTRSGRGLRLTTAGQRYATYARRILGLVEEARGAAVGDTDAVRGLVRIAAVTTAGEHVLPPFLAGFRSRFPDARIDLEVGNRVRVLRLLTEHRADLAIGGRPPAGAGLTIRSVRPNELVVVAAPGVWPGAWSRRRRPHAEAFTWLLREPGSGTRMTAEAYLEQAEADPPRLTLGSNGAVIASAVAGLGVTLVSRDAVVREVDTGELQVVPLAGTPLSRPWHAVTHQTVTATARLLLQHLMDPGAGPDPFTLPSKSA